MTLFDKTPAILIAALLAACAPMDGADTPAPIGPKQAKLLDKELKGKIAGTPVNCISNSNAHDLIRISDDMLLYRVSGKLVYQNKLRSTCPGLARDDDILQIETFSGQYCKGDFIRLVDRMSGMPGPVCSFGEFTPFRKDANVASE